MKKERPILFNGEMVRAILDGRKTQTRRMVRPQPKYAQVLRDGRLEESWDGGFDVVTYPKPPASVGDLLYVRETFALENTYEYHGSHDTPTDGRPIQKHEDDYGSHWLIPRYKATEPDTLLLIKETEHPEDAMIWTPSIHMPRWASRITLEITDVRVERLQEISEDDAMAEGVPTDCDEIGRYCPLKAFEFLWDSVYNNWKENPWVWVVEFRRLEAQEKAA